jgi:hypothetical protein
MLIPKIPAGMHLFFEMPKEKGPGSQWGLTHGCGQSAGDDYMWLDVVHRRSTA